MAVVEQNWGRLVAGNVLVSNFNASSNLQGTGTTIVQMTPHGGRSVFAHITSGDVRGICTGGVGLTTALAILGTGGSSWDRCRPPTVPPQPRRPAA